MKQGDLQFRAREEDERSCALPSAPDRIVQVMLVASLLAVPLCALTCAIIVYFPPFGAATMDYQVPLLGGYQLVRSSANARSVQHERGTGIYVPPHITNIGMDTRFIVCRQEATDDAIPSRDSPRVHYWIIDTAVNTLMGPLEPAAFGKCTIRLGITHIKLRSCQN